MINLDQDSLGVQDVGRWQLKRNEKPPADLNMINLSNIAPSEASEQENMLQAFEDQQRAPPQAPRQLSNQDFGGKQATTNGMPKHKLKPDDQINASTEFQPEF
jgi:hypothetical protein